MLSPSNSPCDPCNVVPGCCGVPRSDAPAEGHPVESAGEEVRPRVGLGPRGAAHHARVALPGTPAKGANGGQMRVGVLKNGCRKM